MPVREVLSLGCKELGLEINDVQLDSFDTFTKLLLEWNRKFNLTRITDPEEIAVLHYVDSLALLAVEHLPLGSSLIDVGTGAGLPGIALKIMRPDLKVTLVDSVRKKLTFVEAVVTTLNLADVELVHSRAEDLAKMPAYREQFDVVVGRAVARLKLLAEFCIPFCKIGGKFIAYKGPAPEDDLQEALKTIKELGGKLKVVHNFLLMGDGPCRTIVVVKKLRPTPLLYPRRPGSRTRVEL